MKINELGILFLFLSGVLCSCVLDGRTYLNEEEKIIEREVAKEYGCYFSCGPYFEGGDNCFEIHVGFCKELPSNKGREKDSIAQLMYFEVLGRIPRIRKLAGCTELIISDYQDWKQKSGKMSYQKIFRKDKSSILCLDFEFDNGVE